MRFSRNIFCSSVLALCLVACSDDSAAINDAFVAISSSSETFNESSSEMSGISEVSSSDALSSENLISSSSELRLRLVLRFHLLRYLALKELFFEMVTRKQLSKCLTSILLKLRPRGVFGL